MTRPFLLITNDDGIHAPGLRHLWQAVESHAESAIVAPLIEKSGAGLSITWGKPLMLNSVHWEGAEAWSLNGTPADCVKMALSVLLKKAPSADRIGHQPRVELGKDSPLQRNGRRRDRRGHERNPRNCFFLFRLRLNSFA